MKDSKYKINNTNKNNERTTNDFKLFNQNKHRIFVWKIKQVTIFVL